MSNDMRMVKFGMMISDIYEDLGRKGLYGKLSYKPDDLKGYGDSWLLIIYDYDELNEYGKAIIDQVSRSPVRKESDIDMQEHFRMEAAKAVTKRLNSGAHYGWEDGYKGEELKLHFLFWALMVLAVDDTNKEEHLSMICAYAKTLKISDDEMMDMVRIIRIFYNIEEDDMLQTYRVIDEFDKVIEKYDIAKLK